MPKELKRLSLFLKQDDYDRINYYSNKLGIDKNELLIRSINHYIDWYNKDFDIPTAEVKRINQLVSNQKINNDILQELNSSILSLTKMIMNLNNGTGYLMDENKKHSKEILHNESFMKQNDGDY